MLVRLVAKGMPTEEILANYPVLEPEDIRQALAYARSLEPDDASQCNRPDEWT